jgi:hypothetical protein
MRGVRSGRILALAGLLVALAVIQVSAGGPVCPPPACPPMVCGPPPCAPPMCAPMPACPPPSCAPYRENPLKKIARGTLDLVTGVIALPFCILDSIAENCTRKCGPQPMCGPMAACPPAPCPPAVCPPPMCGPSYGPPAMGRPVGFGRGVPRKLAPFAKDKPVSERLLAVQEQPFFGNYW